MITVSCVQGYYWRVGRARLLPAGRACCNSFACMVE